MNNIEDPREEGVGGLSGLPSIEEQQRAKTKAIIDGMTFNSLKSAELNSALYAPVKESVGLQYPEVGKSRLDRKITDISQLDNIGDTRANIQSDFSKVINGTAKGVITAGTTFLDGTIGLAVGLYQGIKDASEAEEGNKFGAFFGGLYNNDFSRVMRDLERASEEILPNYYTQYEQENPLAASSIFSANFLGDKFLKNIGFTVGTFYSGSIYSGAAKAITRGAGTLVTKGIKGLTGTYKAFTDTKKIGNVSEAVAQIVGAGTSALNEGRVEALNTVTDWYNLQKAQLDDSYNNKLIELDYLKLINSDEYSAEVSALNDEYNSRDLALQSNATRIGNTDLLLNLAILLPSNLFQFGKIYARGYDSYLKGIHFDKNLGKFVEDVAEKSTGEKIAKGVAKSLSEGKEEVLQQLASDYSGTRYTPSNKDFFNLDFHYAEVDPVSGYQTLETSKALMQTINTTLNNDSTWEQFIVGALTGAIGMPVFGSNTRNAWIGKNKAIGLEGGIMGEILESSDPETAESVRVLNSRLEDPQFKKYYQGLVRHTKFENAMKAAALAGDKKTFKDAEFAQMISDIALFSETGQLSSYKTLLEDALNTSNENINSIIENTSSKRTREDGSEYVVSAFTDSDGNSKEMSEIRKSLESTKKQMLDAVANWSEASMELDCNFGNLISREQKNELIWSKLRGEGAYNRAIDIIESRKELLTSIANDLNSVEEPIQIKDGEEETPLSVYTASVINGLLQNANSKVLDEDTDLDCDFLSRNLERILTSFKFKDKYNGVIKDLLSEFKDIKNLVKDSKEYQDKYTYYKEHLDELAAKLEEDTIKAQKQEDKHKVESLRENLSKASTLQEVNDIIANSNADDETIENATKTSKNPAVREATDLKDKFKSVEVILAGLDIPSQLYSEIIDLLRNFSTQATSLKDLNINSEFFKDPNNLNDRPGESYADKLKRFDSIRKYISQAASLLPEADYDGPTPLEMDELAENYSVDRNSGIRLDEDTPTNNSGANTSATNNPSQPSTSTDTEVREAGVLITTKEEDTEFSQDDKTTEKSISDRLVKLEESELNEENNIPEKDQESYIRPAISKYTYESLKTENWSDTETSKGVPVNSEWKAVHTYLTGKGAFEFVDSDKLEELRQYQSKHKDSDIGKVFFGIDPELNSNTVLMFVKTGEDSYQVIGSNFMSESKTRYFKGLSSLNQQILEEFNKGNKDKLFISDKVSTTIKEIKSGRVRYSDATRDIQEAISNTLNKNITKTLHLVINAVDLISDSPEILNFIRGLKNKNKKEGMSYVTVKNCKGTYSLIPVVAKNFSSDILSSQSLIGKEINSAITEITNALLAKNKTSFKNGLEHLFSYITDRDLVLSLSKDGNRLFIKNKVRNSEGKEERVVGKDGKRYPKTTILSSVDLNNIEEQALYELLINSLVSSGARIRINKNLVSDSEYNKDLINNYLNTHAISLDTEASWFTLNPIEEEKSPQKTQPKQQAELEASDDDRIDIFNAITGDVKYSTSTEERVVTKSSKEVLKESIDRLKKILPQLSTEDAIKVVAKLTTESGRPANGLIDLSKSIITLSKIGVDGTVYHEAYHYVSQLLLSREQLQDIYKEAREICGDISDNLLEEKLADKFRDYMISRETESLGKRILHWFQKLFDIVTNWSMSKSDISGLYRSIAEGRYASTTVKTREAKLYDAQQEEYEKRLQAILDKAPRDAEGHLLAPNGKPTNLTDRQYAQVRTPKFKAWFGDWENNPQEASKVVDENGEPLVVYHNTPFDFNGVFDMNHSSRTMPWTSEPFGHVGTKKTANIIKGTQYALFINIKNPLNTPDFVHETVSSMLNELYKQGIISKDKYSALRGISNEELRDLMQKLGYDGTKYENKAEKGGISYSFINPNQIKSATGNNGEFSKINDNIYYSIQDTVYDLIEVKDRFDGITINGTLYKSFTINSTNKEEVRRDIGSFIRNLPNSLAYYVIEESVTDAQLDQAEKDRSLSRRKSADLIVRVIIPNFYNTVGYLQRELDTTRRREMYKEAKERDVQEGIARGYSREYLESLTNEELNSLIVCN